MARSSGTRNADYEQTRSELLKAIQARLLRTGVDRISFREMAEYAGVSVPTLRHYFGTRTVVVQEIFAELHRKGLRYLEEASKSDLDLEASMRQAAQAILAGARFGGMEKIHRLGLTEGLGNDELGPTYLNSILEPSLQAIEKRLDAHQQRGELKAVITRHAALAFAAPLILATLHQSGLRGDCVRPLDLADFARNHVQAFVHAYGKAARKKREAQSQLRP